MCAIYSTHYSQLGGVGKAMEVTGGRGGVRSLTWSVGAVGGGIVAGEYVAALVVSQAAARGRGSLLIAEDAGLCV